MKKWIVTGLLAALALTLRAQVPEMFRYQGRLVDGTNLVNATLPMSFKLYDALSGGNLVYEDSSSVLVVDGLYSKTIGDNTVYGSMTNALTNAAVYLELTVNGATLSPRERLFSVPYALAAGKTDPARIIELSEALAFGKVVIGSTKTATLTIYNDGGNVMTVTGLQYSDSCFSGNWAGKIRPYHSMDVAVTFAPVSAQSYSGTITVNCDKTSGTNSIACTGTGLTTRYVDHGDGTVTDAMTGLMWLKNAGNIGMPRTDAATYCANLVTNGYSDWRLPSVAREGGAAELDTLFREYGDPSGAWQGYAETPFTFDPWCGYWSSAPYAANTNGAWYIMFGEGGKVKSSDGSYVFYFNVWPVRGGQ